MPKASVIMTVYNTNKEYLKEAIESILNQTFKDFEFIIIDDCSKEPIADIINSYQDNRIKFIRNEVNLGVTQAPNIGLEIASGEYVFKFDSDDIACKDRFEKQIAYLDANPEIDVLSAAVEMFPRKRIVKNPLTDSEIKHALIFYGDCIAHPCVAIRRSSIIKYNLRYESNYEACEDYALWLKHINQLTFANLPDVLLKYRWHGKNISIEKSFMQHTISQYIMFKAQAKHFSIDSDDILELISKYKNGYTPNYKDLIKILDFATCIHNNLSKEKPDALYVLNRTFMKMFLKKCRKNFDFIKVIFSEKLAQFINLTFLQKIGIIFGI